MPNFSRFSEKPQLYLPGSACWNWVSVKILMKPSIGKRKESISGYGNGDTSITVKGRRLRGNIEIWFRFMKYLSEKLLNEH